VEVRVEVTAAGRYPPELPAHALRTNPEMAQSNRLYNEEVRAMRSIKS
jgi:hypothetical protein